MIDLLYFLAGMAFVEAILKPTIVFFTQKEARRIKAIADLLMPELMARTDPYMPDWIKQGRPIVAEELWSAIRTTAKDQGVELDIYDIPLLLEQFSKLYSPFENARRFARDQE